MWLKMVSIAIICLLQPNPIESELNRKCCYGTPMKWHPFTRLCDDGTRVSILMCCTVQPCRLKFDWPHGDCCHCPGKCRGEKSNETILRYNLGPVAMKLYTNTIQRYLSTIFQIIQQRLERNLPQV